MPTRYAGTELHLMTQAITRFQVISAVRTIMGPESWESRVPLQLRELPSFAFLCPTIDDIAEFPSDVDEDSTVRVKKRADCPFHIDDDCANHAQNDARKRQTLSP